MRSLIVLVLAIAALSAAPPAHADDTCDATGSVCATNDSYGETSDCDTYGNAKDERGVRAAVLDASAVVAVYDYCWNWGWGPGSGVGAYHAIDTAATGGAEVGAEWSAAAWYCETGSWLELEAGNTGLYNYGSCPAGPPPHMPLRDLGVLP